MRSLAHFEAIARSIRNVGARDFSETQVGVHPFDERNIHPDISAVSKKLFDDGYYSHATFEAFKYLDSVVKNLAGMDESGHKLMMNAFNEAAPKIKLTDLVTTSDKDEQMGFRFMLAGAMSGIRNPRGHEILTDPIDRSLDHLSLASVLLRRIEERKEPKP